MGIRLCPLWWSTLEVLLCRLVESVLTTCRGRSFLLRAVKISSALTDLELLDQAFLLPFYQIGAYDDILFDAGTQQLPPQQLIHLKNPGNIIHPDVDLNGLFGSLQDFNF